MSTASGSTMGKPEVVYAHQRKVPPALAAINSYLPTHRWMVTSFLPYVESTYQILQVRLSLVIYLMSTPHKPRFLRLLLAADAAIVTRQVTSLAGLMILAYAMMQTAQQRRDKSCCREHGGVSVWFLDTIIVVSVADGCTLTVAPLSGYRERDRKAKERRIGTEKEGRFREMAAKQRRCRFGTQREPLDCTAILLYFLDSSIVARR